MGIDGGKVNIWLQDEVILHLERKHAPGFQSSCSNGHLELVELARKKEFK